jgi:hypothetical protein
MAVKTYKVTFYVRKHAKGSFSGGGALQDIFHKNITASDINVAKRKAAKIASAYNKAHKETKASADYITAK